MFRVDESPSAPLSGPPGDSSPGANPPSPDDVATGTRRRAAIRTAFILAAAFVACIGVYLVLNVPGNWFPNARPVGWPARDLTLARGTGQLFQTELIITAPDATGITLVSTLSNLRSQDYAAVAWLGADFPNEADVRLLWRTDHAPGRLNSAPVSIESGRLLPVVVAKNPAWVGRITGVALAIHGPLPQPVRLSGVIAKPLGAAELLQDRAREWLAFESWTGTSINTITGGADVQDLPLPLLLGAALVLATGVVLIAERLRPGVFVRAAPLAVGAFFLAAWLVLDTRWAANLVKQELVTAEQYAGKSWREKHLASEDAPLFAFIEQARAVLPSTPVRIFVAADAHYFRGRAAYLLYPHSVFFDPVSNRLPQASLMRPDDWLLVYQQRGIQYDQANRMLRWYRDQTLSAELKLLDRGAALFLIR